MPQCTSQGRPSAPPVVCAEPGSPPPLSRASDGHCAEVEAASMGQSCSLCKWSSRSVRARWASRGTGMPVHRLPRANASLAFPLDVLKLNRAAEHVWLSVVTVCSPS